MNIPNMNETTTDGEVTVKFKKAIDPDIEEMAELNKEAMELLRNAQQCDSELAAIKDVPGKEQMRAALVARRNQMHRQRFTVKQRAREIGKRKTESRRLEALGLMAGVSPTAQLREAARRTGILEELYISLCKGVDGGFGDSFNWQRSLDKARKKLGEQPPADLPAALGTPEETTQTHQNASERS
jgi:hypothetical protein